MNTNNFFVKSALIAAMSLAFANSALAVEATGTMDITVLVAKSCVVAADALDFGTYAPDAEKTGTSTITTKCTAATPYTIALGVGENTNRRLKGATTATEFISYELYQPDNSTLWNASETVVNADLVGGELTYTVNGKIAAGQYKSAQTYTDTVAVTVTY